MAHSLPKIFYKPSKYDPNDPSDPFENGTEFRLKNFNKTDAIYIRQEL
jgi:hypothetical protein